MTALKTACIFLLFHLAPQSLAAPCSMAYDQIPIYEKQILMVLDGPNRSALKSLERISEPLTCLIKMAQTGSGATRLAVSNTFYALIGGQALPGASEAEMKRFQRSALLMKALGSADPKQADYLANMLSGFLKGEWEAYKLFCEQGDISHCLVFLPEESDVDLQDDLMAAATLLKWQIAHSKIDFKQRAELEQRMRSLFEKRKQYSILKRWFIEKIYSEMMPQERSMGMALS